MKVTTVAPANIAFIKYWGRADHELFLPRNNSISMTMSGCKTKTMLELTKEIKEDSVKVKFLNQSFKKLDKKSTKNRQVYDQIERIRQVAGVSQKVKIRSENNFPADAGLASSSSGFAALTAGLLLVYGLRERFDDRQELSREVRLCGSGSAVRSVYGGFVEFVAGEDHQSSYAEQIADEQYWDLVDIVAVVDAEKKKVSSSLGHKLADTSPYFETRIKEMQERIIQCRQAILERDIEKLGVATEQDSVSLHAVMMTSRPPAVYWGPGSMGVWQEVMQWREEEGLQAYCAFDAGANPHVICEKKDAKEVQKRLEANEFVQWTIWNQPCAGVRVVEGED